MSRDFDLQIFLGDGTGAFQMPLTANFVFAARPDRIIAGDFDGDGKLDLAVLDRYSQSMRRTRGAVWVFLGNGDGTFRPQQVYYTEMEDNTTRLVAGDLNGDGILDIAVTKGNTDSVAILLGKGDGSFEAPSFVSVGRNPLFIVAEDLRLTGILDLITVNNGGTLSVLISLLP